MIIAYVGLDGSGKTYHMAETAQNLIKKKIDVFGTTPFKGGRVLENERQLMRIQNAHVFFDEWHQDHDAKEWYQMDPVLKHIVSQHRKYGLVIHWSAQNWFFMDAFIRRETAFVWEHEAMFRDRMSGRSRIRGTLPFIGRFDGLSRAFKYAGMEAELRHRKPIILERRHMLFKESIYRTYDSYKTIALSSKQISDEEVLQIKDPYAQSVINDVSSIGPKTHIRELPDNLILTQNIDNDHIYAENEKERQNDVYIPGDILQNGSDHIIDQDVYEMPLAEVGFFTKILHRLHRNHPRQPR